MKETVYKELPYERYNHHGHEVWVKKDLKGKHREHCLCWECERFKPDEREKSCVIANLVYALCVAEGLVLPVWECGFFFPRKEGEGEKG